VKTLAPLTVALQQSPWASDLDAASLAKLSEEISLREVSAGQFVVRRGDPVTHWLGVVSGLVKISNDSAEGKTVTFTGVPEGGWFGEGSMLKNEPRRYDVVALRDSTIALMPRATFEWLLNTSLRFNRFLIDHLNERLGQFIGMVEYDRLLEPDARVARCLATLFNTQLYPRTGPRLKLSQEEIGLLSGVSRQRANQALQVLERAGLLAVEYGGLRVIDLDGLRRYG
jgi:CRP/FNR family transcriptional regulator, cyclic AMP receptor protein